MHQQSIQTAGYDYRLFIWYVYWGQISKLYLHLVLHKNGSLSPESYHSPQMGPVIGIKQCLLEQRHIWVTTSHDDVIKMETFSALLAICAGNSPVPGEFPVQRPVRWSFDVFFDLRLNKRLSKQSGGWWFDTPSRQLWGHRNVKLPITRLLCQQLAQATINQMFGTEASGVVHRYVRY